MLILFLFLCANIPCMNHLSKKKSISPPPTWKPAKGITIWVGKLPKIYKNKRIDEQKSKSLVVEKQGSVKNSNYKRSNLGIFEEWDTTPIHESLYTLEVSPTKEKNVKEPFNTATKPPTNPYGGDHVRNYLKLSINSQILRSND